MPNPVFVQRSFAGGEIAPTLAARTDQDKNRFGVKLLRNMMVLRNGAITNRPGTVYICNVKDSTKQVRLLPFAFSDADSYALEVGDEYIRFIRSGARLTVAGPTAWSATRYYEPGDIVRIGASGAYAHYYCIAPNVNLTPPNTTYWYALTMTDLDDTPTTGGISIMEVPTPYQDTEVFDLTYTQSNDVLTITHPNYPPYELIRYDATEWTMLPMPFAPAIRSPAGIQVTRNGTGNQTYRYKVTSIKKDRYEESLVGYAGKQLAGTIDNTGAGGDLQVTFAADPLVSVGTLVLIVDATPTGGTVDEAFEAQVIGQLFSVRVDAPPAIDLGIIENGGGVVTSSGIVAPSSYSVDVVIMTDTAGTAALSGFDFTNVLLSGSTSGDVIVTHTGHGFVTGDVVHVAVVVKDDDSAPTNRTLAKELSGKAFPITVIGTNDYTLDGTTGIAGTFGNHDAYVFPTWCEISGAAVPAPAVTGDGVDQKQHVIRCAKVDDAAEYWVYKEKNGVYGFIGAMTAAGALGEYELRDEGQEPDTTKTPPSYRNPFLAADNYPGAVGYFQQRLVFAGTDNNPQRVLLSRAGDFQNFTTRSPLGDDDSLDFSIDGQRVGRIKHVVAGERLAILTDASQYIARGDENGALTPGLLNLSATGYNGADTPTPILVSNKALFVQARGAQVREMPLLEITGEPARDLTTWAAHLVDGYTLADWCYARTAQPMVWAARSDGGLLSMTYVPEQDIYAWARHDSANASGDADFESVCATPEGDDDIVYVLVQRLVNGTETRMIERMPPRLAGFETYSVVTNQTIPFLDSAILSTAGTTTVGGLTHLVGRTVYGRKDGVTIGPFTVSGAGEITGVGTGWSVLFAGIPITSDVETLPVDPSDARVQMAGRKRAEARVTALVHDSRGFYAGPTTSDLRQFSVPPNYTATQLHSGPASIIIGGGWETEGTVVLRQTEPQPFTLLGIAVEVAVGGSQ